MPRTLETADLASLARTTTFTVPPSSTWGGLSSIESSCGGSESDWVENTRSAAVRSEDGQAIPKDAEVLVTRFDKGIAYVRPWDSTDSKETL